MNKMEKWYKAMERLHNYTPPEFVTDHATGKLIRWNIYYNPDKAELGALKVLLVSKRNKLSTLQDKVVDKNNIIKCSRQVGKKIAVGYFIEVVKYLSEEISKIEAEIGVIERKIKALEKKIEEQDARDNKNT